ncbi:MAG: hypothetical protein ACI33K_02745 [Clostridiaceae bacterium]
MDKKVIDIISGEAIVYYEGGYLETVPLILTSNSINPGESMKNSKALYFGSHTRENQLVQRELYFY